MWHTIYSLTGSLFPWGSWTFLYERLELCLSCPIFASIRRFALHPSSFDSLVSLNLDHQPATCGGTAIGGLEGTRPAVRSRARGTLAGRVLKPKPLIERRHHSISQQVSGFVCTTDYNKKSRVKTALKRWSSPLSQVLPVREFVRPSDTSGKKRRLTDRIGCTRLAGSTRA